MIHLAVDDSKTPVKTDTTFLHTEVTTRSGPNPPNESVDSIGARLAQPNFVCMIDDENRTVAGFDVQEVSQEVSVIWWLPRAWEDDGIHAAEDNQPLLVPVFGAACEEVMARTIPLTPEELLQAEPPEPRLRWPGSAPWKIFGWYPGVGDTFEKRTESSREMVQFWLDYFNRTPAGLIATLGQNSYNESQYGPISRVDDMADFAKWVAR